MNEEWITASHRLMFPQRSNEKRPSYHSIRVHFLQWNVERRIDSEAWISSSFTCSLIRELAGSLKYYGHVFGEREITIVSTWTRWVHKSSLLAGKVPIGLTYIRWEWQWTERLSLGTLISSRMLKVSTSILTIRSSFITLICGIRLVRGTTFVPLFPSLAPASASSGVTTIQELRKP